MENKYQEALEVISEFIGSYDNNTMLDVAMNDLQRLIDLHDIDYVVIAKQSQDLQKLEKALDNACELLEGYEGTSNNKLVEWCEEDDKELQYPYPTKDMWKKSLLEESENQDGKN